MDGTVNPALAPPVPPATTAAACGPTAPLTVSCWLKSWLLYPCVFPKAVAKVLGSIKPGFFKLCAMSLNISESARES